MHQAGVQSWLDMTVLPGGTRSLVAIRNLLSGHVMREQRDAVGLIRGVDHGGSAAKLQCQISRIAMNSSAEAVSMVAETAMPQVAAR